MEGWGLTGEFVDKFLIAGDKWSKHRSKDRVWNETCKLSSENMWKRDNPINKWRV